MMLEASQDLSEIVENTARWGYSEPEGFIAIHFDAEGVRSEHAVSRDALATLHPLFPDALRELVREHRHQYGDHFDVWRQHVQATLVMLQTGGVHCELYRGQAIIFGRVDDARVSDSDDCEWVWLSGVVNDVVYVEVGGHTLPLVMQTTSDLLSVSYSALETRYPNWQQRLTLGKELGLENPELFLHVFNNRQEPATSVVLPTLGFE